MFLYALWVGEQVFEVLVGTPPSIIRASNPWRHHRGTKDDVGMHRTGCLLEDKLFEEKDVCKDGWLQPSSQWTSDKALLTESGDYPATSFLLGISLASIPSVLGAAAYSLLEQTKISRLVCPQWRSDLAQVLTSACEERRLICHDASF